MYLLCYNVVIVLVDAEHLLPLRLQVRQLTDLACLETCWTSIDVLTVGVRIDGGVALIVRQTVGQGRGGAGGTLW